MIEKYERGGAVMKIINAKMYYNGSFRTGDMIIRGERFLAIRETDENGKSELPELDDQEEIDAHGLLAIPGLVDIHFHGCVGYDMCDGTEEAIQAMADYQQSVGVLAICPATMTYPEDKLAVIAEAAAAHVNGKGADLVGIHMEGPYISPNKVGAQNPAYVQKPDMEMFARLQEKAGGLFRQCDIAPEEPGALEFIRGIRETVPSISLAHTTADYDAAMAAFEAGANHLTHCYNAMPGINHRNPGPIIAAVDAGADAELITDNVHIHPAVVRATFKLFGDDHVILVSDSMMACGLPDGQYSLGGQVVTVKGRLATLTEQEGTIAGSATNLMDCVRRAVQEMGIPLEAAVKAASHNPARSIGIDKDYGDIAPGKYANVLLLDDELKLVHVIQRGKMIF